MKNKNIKTGNCGFCGRKEDYAEVLSCVEVQQTFYQPPQIKIFKHLRAVMPINGSVNKFA